VREHELTRRVDVLVRLPTASERGLLLRRQQREAIHRLDVVVEASERYGSRKRQRSTGHSTISFRGGRPEFTFECPEAVWRSLALGYWECKVCPQFPTNPVGYED